MSRVNKYRGMHIHVYPGNEHLNVGWVYGYLADENYINSPELEGEFLVDKDTVGQYIGVPDKNGKEIYEKDIAFIDGEDEYFVVEWDKDTARFVMNSETLTVDFDNYWGYQMRVVGNMYENADLLKEAGNE